ncbi:hypothetical protein CKM354_001152900 [Cercospora kikuchii]|uniref:F-box domain-containing protein n=1 Tax=Cercospora kikuchii TaxID=84275 RepID=A0A9P3CX64_9PEZI|nr:uncharacterized protein CKM354_001152900 [Cercospora kikuchii]GIZ48470.1 hypothetical protein CKM354_001152900 [Cercospora kikuchii]
MLLLGVTAPFPAAVEATCTELTATKRGHLSTDQVGGHKPHNAEGKAISNVADSSVGQIAAPQLNGKIVHMSVVKDQAARTEESDACHNLFHTVELLEHILSEIPIEDLLFAQGVCKTWKNCINHSKSLQMGLFLVPLELKPVQMEYDIGEADDVRKARCEKASASDTAVVKFLRRCIGMCINPLLLSVFSRHELATYMMDRSKCPRTGDAFTRPEASWKRMSASYPPLAITDIFLHIENKLEERGDSLQALFTRLGPTHAVLCEEDFTMLGRDCVALVSNLMQHCDTAAQLTREVDKIGQQDIL